VKAMRLILETKECNLLNNERFFDIIYTIFIYILYVTAKFAPCIKSLSSMSKQRFSQSKVEQQ
jgi:hypothetical protein